jgi:hypothetical protein
MQTATRILFKLWVYQYENGSGTTTKGDLLRKYYVSSSYGRAQPSTNKFAVGGNIDLYLNHDDQFEVVIGRMYGSNIKDILLVEDDCVMHIERIH